MNLELLSIKDITDRLLLIHPYIKIIDDEYFGNNKPLNVICLLHDIIWTTTWDNLLHRKYGCSHCLSEAHSGENHHNYNPNLTNEDRLKLSRHDIENIQNIKKWRREVYRRDNYTCQICCKRNGFGKTIYLNAHHLNGWSWCVEGRFDINNGITLCKDCHNLFHGVYGNKNNTKNQFEEFKLMLY